MNLKDFLIERGGNVDHARTILNDVQEEFQNNMDAEFVCVHMQIFCMKINRETPGLWQTYWDQTGIHIRTYIETVCLSGHKTVEECLSWQVGVNVYDLDPSDIYQFRVIMIEELLKELE